MFRTQAPTEPMVRSGKVQLLEKHLRHVNVEMLAGVYEDLFNALGPLDGAGDHTGFYELWAGTDYGEEFHIKPRTVTCKTGPSGPLPRTS